MGRGWCLSAPVVVKLRVGPVGVICGLGGLRGLGMALMPLGAAGALWRVHWCPATPGSRGFFWAGSGVFFGGSAQLGSG